MEGIRKNVSLRIRKCGVCQNTKYQREQGFDDEVVHHLYRLTPLIFLSVETVGSLKQDENGNSFIIFIICKFSKLCILYPAKNTISAE